MKKRFRQSKYKQLKFFPIIPGTGGWNISGQDIGLKSEFSDLGTLISQLFSVFYYIAAFLMFIWAVWGAFQYIFAGGDKDGLAKARSRITWAIVGFLFISASYALSQFIIGIFSQGMRP